VAEAIQAGSYGIREKVRFRSDKQVIIGTNNGIGGFVLLKKIYPADQIERYLMVDVFIIMVLVYRVLFHEEDVLLWGRLAFPLLFLACYYAALWHRDWRLLCACLIGCMLLAVMGSYFGNWLLLYGFVFADLLGRASSKGMIAGGMAGIVAMFALFSWLDADNPAAFVATLGLPVMVAQLALSIVVHTRENASVLKEKLALADAHLERYIKEEERSRIARDLHDTLGQTLTMIKLKSELTMRLVDKNPQKAKDELHDILNNSRHALKQVRELVSDMKFISLKKEIELSRDMLGKVGIELAADWRREAMPPLSNVAETMLAISVREAITNIMKHSGASRCTIVLCTDGEHYIVKVSDNGNGNLQQGAGNGIPSMKERMFMLQGEANLSATPGEGTIIVLQVPLIGNGRVSST
jgi:two-component system sensor histidine kinase DesK